MAMLKLRLMLWIAKQLFNYITVVRVSEDRGACFLAHNERDMTIAVRTYVEALDEGIDERLNHK